MAQNVPQPSPAAVQLLVGPMRTARITVKVVGWLATVGGAGLLVLMLGAGVTQGFKGMQMGDIALLGSVAIGFLIGLGLIGLSEPARAGGTVWYILWGILNLVAGFMVFSAAAGARGVALVAFFPLVVGCLQLLFGVALASKRAAFVCKYAKNDLSPENVLACLRKAAADPAFANFARETVQSAGLTLEPPAQSVAAPAPDVTEPPPAQNEAGEGTTPGEAQQGG